MRPCSYWFAPRSRPWLLAALALVAVISTDLIGFDANHLRSHIFNASSASSWSHHADAGALAVGGIASLLGAWRSAGRRQLWAPLAAILALLFLDEVSSGHTRVDQLSYGKLLYVPVLIVVVGCVWRLSSDTDEAILVRAALATLAISYVIHILGPHADNALGWGRHGWPYQIKVGFKEGTELAGLVLAVWALCRMAWPLAARR